MRSRRRSLVPGVPATTRVGASSSASPSTARSSSTAAAASATSTSPTRRGARSRPTAPTPCSCATPGPATATSTGTDDRGRRTPGWWEGVVGPGLRPRHRPLLRRVRQRARRLPGLDRARRRPIPTTAGPTGRASRSSRSATWCGRSGRWPTTSASARGSASSAGRWAGCRRSSGRSCSPSGWRRSSRSAPAPRPPRSRSRGRPSAGGPSASTRAGAAATTTTPRPATGPHEGLAIARMIAQVTFRCDDVFTDRFGRALADADAEPLDLWQRFEVERYLDYHGDKLVRRFDANSLPRAGQGDGPPRRRPGPGEPRPPRWPASRCPSLSIGIWSDMLYPVVPAAPDGRAGQRRRRAGRRTSRSTRPTATTPS